MIKDFQYVMHRSCLRKKNLSKKKADDIVDEFAQRGILLYYYKCQFCGSFHMTSKEPDKVVKHFRVV